MGHSSTDQQVYIHQGVVSEISGTTIKVTLDADVHCESCRAKALCGVAESGGKEVEIAMAGGPFQLHEPVEVMLRKDLGQQAVFWAYLLPFLLMLATLLTTSLFLEEWAAGAASLMILIPYYILVSRFGNYFKKTFRISVLKPD